MMYFMVNLCIFFFYIEHFAMAHDFSFPLLCTHIFNNYMEFQTQHSKVLGFFFNTFFFIILFVSSSGIALHYSILVKDCVYGKLKKKRKNSLYYWMFKKAEKYVNYSVWIAVFEVISFFIFLYYLFIYFFVHLHVNPFEMK